MIPESVISSYVTLLTDPVAPYTVLMRTPFTLSLTLESLINTFETSLSSRPPTEPMLSPWPPEHVPPVNVMSEPELIARQSSWFLTFALRIVMPVLVPTSNASVL